MKLIKFASVLLLSLGCLFSVQAQLAAENYYYRGALKEFVGDANGATSDYSEAAMTYYRKGCAEDSLSNPAGALRYFDLALGLKPDFAEVFFRKGMLRDNAGDHKGALKDLDKAIELDHTMVQAYLERGHVKSHLGDHKGAIKEYTKALKLDPANEIALTNRAADEQNSGKLKKAMKDYNKAIEINPEYILAYFNRGLLQKRLGKATLAIADFDAALALSVVNNISIEDLCGGHPADYRNPDEDPGKAIDLSPHLAMVYKTKRALLMSSCNNEESLPDMKGILRNDKKNSEAYFKRGAAKMEIWDYKGAMNDFSRTIELDPGNYFAYVFRGDMKCHSGDYWGGIDDYSKAIELNPKFADAWQNRGVARLLIKQRDKACTDLSQAGELGCSNVYELIIKHCNH